MSPRKIHESDHATKGVINGPRPATLRINRDSYHITKPSSSQLQPSAIDNSFLTKPQAAVPAKQQHPVIIYTHSPKIIHTKACDFMELVQKLTGLEDVHGKKTVKPEPEESSETEENAGFEHDDDTWPQKLVVGEVKMEAPLMFKDCHQYWADAPLFTPNSSHFFCSSRPNHLFQSPAMASSVSPTFMEFVTRFPER